MLPEGTRPAGEIVSYYGDDGERDGEIIAFLLVGSVT